jgi:hypothetical protein
MTKYLTKWEELEGKTISKISKEDETLYVIFSDNTRAVIETYYCGTGYDFDIILLEEEDIWLSQKLYMGWITQEEYDQKIEKERNKEFNRQKRYELQTLAKLKAKYEKEV